jgi:nucleoside 2-deoxyribosyltransferase
MPKASAPPKIYLAGPEVFLRKPAEIAEAKIAICALHGLAGMFPIDAGPISPGQSLQEHGYAIFRANESLIDACDALIANLTPFRGPGMDVGTAYEIGFMRGKGRPVFGYTNSHLSLFDRTLKHDREGVRRRKDFASTMSFEDRDQLGVEQFGFHENLMINGAIDHSGAIIVARKTKRRDRYTDLAAFEECVAHAAAILLPDRR